MKVIENKTIYVCEFCEKKLFIKSAMDKHERYCSKNPENFKACSGCIHLKEEKYEYDKGDDYYGEPQYGSTKTFKCSLLNKEMYPTIVERKGYVQKYPSQFQGQEPMPKECDKKEYF